MCCRLIGWHYDEMDLIGRGYVIPRHHRQLHAVMTLNATIRVGNERDYILHPMMRIPHLDEVFPCDMFLPKALTGIELQLADDLLQILPNQSKVWRTMPVSFLSRPLA